MNRAEKLYYYPQHSILRFLKYCYDVVGYSKQIPGSRIVTVADMIWCNLRYGIMDPLEYDLFEFKEKSNAERETYFTKRQYYTLMKSFDKETFFRLIEKENQYEDYAPFIKRNWMLVECNTSEASVKSFLNENNPAICKPCSSEQGMGIQLVSLEDDEKIKELIAKATNSAFLLEERLENHKVLQAINPSSLNTVRVTYVLKKNGDPFFINAMLRAGGKKDAIVDNWGGGGVLYNIDVNAGKVICPGMDEKHTYYNQHPTSGVPMDGFQLPSWLELMAFADRVARHNPEVIYGGLDIAILEDRVELIELNFPPASLGYQVFGYGALPDIKMINE